MATLKITIKTYADQRKCFEPALMQSFIAGDRPDLIRNIKAWFLDLVATDKIRTYIVKDLCLIIDLMGDGEIAVQMKDYLEFTAKLE